MKLRGFNFAPLDPLFCLPFFLLLVDAFFFGGIVVRERRGGRRKEGGRGTFPYPSRHIFLPTKHAYFIHTSLFSACTVLKNQTIRRSFYCSALLQQHHHVIIYLSPLLHQQPIGRCRRQIITSCLCLSSHVQQHLGH